MALNVVFKFESLKLNSIARIKSILKYVHKKKLDAFDERMGVGMYVGL